MYTILNRKKFAHIFCISFIFVDEIGSLFDLL
jgi:hypothetical protein